MYKKCGGNIIVFEDIKKTPHNSEFHDFDYSVKFAE